MHRIQAPYFSQPYRSHETWTHLERLFSGVDQLVSLQLGALDKGLATLCTDVDARPVSMEMLPHGRIVPEHLGTALHGHSTTYNG